MIEHEHHYRRCQRCFEILEFLAGGHEASRESLAERCRCSIRTIAADIKFLRGAGFQIRYSKKKGSYALEGLFPFPALRQRQILELFLGTQVLTLKGMQGDYHDIVREWLATLSETEQRVVQELTSRICMAPPGKMCAPEILYKVYQAVAECRVIKIDYQRFSTNTLEKGCSLEPYGIYVNSRGDFYMIGKCFGRHEMGYRRFKLCRIVRIELLGTFTYPSDFSIRDEMRQGFWSGEQASITVTLRFTPAVAQLIYEREPEASIRKQPDGSLIVRKTVCNVKEILWEILSYEANVEVVEPPALRELAQKRIEQMRQVYERGLDINKKWQEW